MYARPSFKKDFSHVPAPVDLFPGSLEPFFTFKDW